MSQSVPTRIVPVASLVLCPEEIFHHNSIFNSLHIRSGSATPFEMFPIDQHQIARYFKSFGEKAQEALLRFNDGDMAFEIAQLSKRHAREKSGTTLDKFLDKTTTRYIRDLMLELMGGQDELRCYQRVKADQRSYRISKCVIHKLTPALQFDVRQTEDGALIVVPEVQIGEKRFDLAALKRYKFLIQDENNYYLLKHTDYLTLVWLEASMPQQYAQQPVLLSQRIVQKLEENYRVNRNDLFPVVTIDATPCKCIYLSEISETMLMFTPKWRYEDILVDGEWKAEQETVRNGTAYKVIRNKQDEQDFTSYLQGMHPAFAKQSNKFFYLSFADAKKKQWFLNFYHSLLADDVEIIGLELLRYFRYSSFSAVTEMTILRQEDEWLTLSISIKFGKESIQLNELQKLLLSGQHSVLLKDNTIGVFNDEWINQYAPIIKHGKVSRQEVTIPKWIMLSLEKGEAKTVLEPAMSEEWRSKWIRWQDEHDQVYIKPDSVNAELRSYQQKGFEWLALLSEIGAGACLADDMGLGKTLQTITFIAWRLQRDATARQIIVCPASLMHNWQKEFAKFSPTVSTMLFNGQQRNLDHFFEGNINVLICSYGTLRSDIDILKIVAWDTIVVDESQNIKNVGAMVTRSVGMLNAACKVAMSGTPIMNNTFDLYAQLNFLLPGLFGGQEFFRREYALPIDQNGDKEKIAALQKITAPFVLRRTKEQVAKDLPEKIESVLWCEMGEDQLRAYNKVKSQISDSLFLDIKTGGIAKSKLNVLQGILKLRQLCDAPQLLKEETDCADSVKLDVLMEELDKLRDTKSLVFSQFKGMLHLIADRCRESKIRFYHFDGDTPIAERQQMVDQFQSETDDTSVFLISLKSGNAGLNLTAADYVFLVDPWWNTAVQQQAIDRTHRIGQTKTVSAYKMICKGSIEERIMDLQQKKKTLSEELISAEEGFVKNLTEEDIAYLFG